jgi:succinate dehydrogenase hydrophobic anchor subunit
MSVLTAATRRNIPEDTIRHSHRRENLKSYIQNIMLVIFIAGILLCDIF